MALSGGTVPDQADQQPEQPGAIYFGAIANPTRFDWYPRWAATAEDAGLAVLATGDSQSLWADPFVTLGIAATVTKSPRLAVTVSNPRTRHPAVVTSMLATLNEASDGRAVYGIGSGDSALRNIGLPPARVAEVRDFVGAVKGLASGEEVSWQGAPAAVRWSRRETPIWMAAEGPRMQYLAGQLADGVLLSNALHPEVLRTARQNLAAGAEAAGRSVDDIEIWCMAAMCFADSEREGIHALRAILAGTANHVYRFRMEHKDVPEHLRDPLTTLKRHYDSRHHASPASGEHNARLIEDLGLVDFLAERSVIAGPPERCAERISELAELGVTRFLVHHQANEPVSFMETFARSVSPALPLAG